MKNKYTQTIAGADRAEILKISEILQKNHKIKLIKAPQKTLTMVKMREPVEASLYYLGEVLCCECMVEVDGIKGASIIMGDDFEKVQAAAVIDAAYNGDFEECKKLDERLSGLEEKQKDARKVMNGELLKSKVDFSVMGE